MATIPWKMSASLQCVRRAGVPISEVTSLERAVREWLLLDDEMREQAVLTPECSFQWREEGPSLLFSGNAIATLASFLPAAPEPTGSIEKAVSAHDDA